MVPRIIKKIKSSIFLKMTLIIIASGIMINFVLNNMHRILAPVDLSKGRVNLEKYAEYIVKDIGIPPDKKYAEKLSKELNLWIQYTSPSESWSSDPAFTQKNMNIFSGHTDRKVIMEKGRFYMKINEGKYIFIISQDLGPVKLQKDFVVLFFFTVSIILVLAYFLIRKILFPVKLLSHGVNEVSKGNLDHAIPVLRKDELGELSESFNVMSSRIKEMIKSRDQLLLDVSHELRSPLTRMKVSLEFMDKSEITASIAEDIHEIETMITEILETERLDSRHGGIDKKIINLTNLLNNLTAEYADRKPGVLLNGDKNFIEINGDESRLKTAFRNILDNAVKYSAETSRPVEVSTFKKNNSAYIIFKDNGIGIDQEHIPFIFEPFYRADKSRSKKTGGYGLGMSLCKKIIDSHNGTITVESNRGEGSLFTIVLPV